MRDWFKYFSGTVVVCLVMAACSAEHSNVAGSGGTTTSAAGEMANAGVRPRGAMDTPVTKQPERLTNEQVPSVATAQTGKAPQTNQLSNIATDTVVKSAQVVVPPAPRPAASTTVTVPTGALPSTVTDGPPVKKSTSNICHARGTAHYKRTKNFTPYDSIRACVDSGGRLPKG